jgi:hypothetical protein
MQSFPNFDPFSNIDELTLKAFLSNSKKTLIFLSFKAHQVTQRCKLKIVCA